MEPLLSWEDLAAADAAPSGPVPSATATDVAPAPPTAAGSLVDALAGVELPAEVVALLEEYERCEARLRQLTGHEPAPEVDPREAARFPVKVHTAASRLEERRLALLDEAASAARKRVQEHRTLDRRRQAELLELAARRRELLRLAATRERRDAELERERVARRAADEVIRRRLHERWDADRRRALADSAARRQGLRRHEERRLDETRAVLVEERSAQRRAERSHDERRERALARRRGGDDRG